MVIDANNREGIIHPGPFIFATTRWSLVLTAGDSASPQSADALQYLCQTYWYPLYAHVRRRGAAVDEAQDLVQGFFQHFLGSDSVARARQERGRFRSFLLGALEHYLSRQREHRDAAKRGGGERLLSLDTLEAEGRFSCEVADEAERPEAFDRRWARTLVAHAVGNLKREMTVAGKSRHYDILKRFLSEPAADGEYGPIARDLQVTEGAIRVAVRRLRERYAELVREEVAHTVSTEADIAAEIRYLIELLSK